jgi:hypothetical protein
MANAVRKAMMVRTVAKLIAAKMANAVKKDTVVRTAARNLNR